MILSHGAYFRLRQEMGPPLTAFSSTLSSNGTRLRFAVIAVFFAVAQLLFAAHAADRPGDLDLHAPQTCEFCMAGAIADDPLALEVTLAPPIFVFAVNSADGRISDGRGVELRIAFARGPPLR